MRGSGRTGRRDLTVVPDHFVCWQNVNTTLRGTSGKIVGTLCILAGLSLISGFMLVFAMFAR
jgi:hypothetical protein